jgi:hypothetical protein
MRGGLCFIWGWHEDPGARCPQGGSRREASEPWASVPPLVFAGGQAGPSCWCCRLAAGVPLPTANTPARIPLPTCTVQCNAHAKPVLHVGGLQGDRVIRGGGLYSRAALFNHECLPNLARFDCFDAAPAAGGPPGANTGIQLRALHDIPQGELASKNLTLMGVH